MTDKTKWASDVTNAIAGIATATSGRVLSILNNNKKNHDEWEKRIEELKAVLEALLKDGV